MIGGGRAPAVIGAAGLPMRDVMDPGVIGWVVDRHHDDDVRSIRDLSLAVVTLCTLDLPAETKDRLLERLDWRPRDARARRREAPRHQAREHGLRFRVPGPERRRDQP